MRERSFLEARRAWREDASRPTDRIALGSALVGGLLVLSVLLAQILFSSVQPPSLSRLLGDGASQAPRVTSGHVAATPAVAAPAPTLTAAPTDVPTDVPTGASGERLQVSGTDGQGVVLRASPHEDDKVPRGFMDGSWVTVLDRSGPDWALVLGDNGQQGWVPVHYLTR
jgi:hypothetical protein